jgi:hypothetical protein
METAKIISEGILASQCAIFQFCYRIIGKTYGEGDKYPTVLILAPANHIAVALFQAMNKAKNGTSADLTRIVDVQWCDLRKIDFQDRKTMYHVVS